METSFQISQQDLGEMSVRKKSVKLSEAKDTVETPAVEGIRNVKHMQRKVTGCKWNRSKRKDI